MLATGTALFSTLRPALFSALLASLLLLVCDTDARSQVATGADDAISVFNKAQDAHEKGDLKTAIQLYGDALKILPQFPEAEYQRAVALLALGKADEAEQGLRQAVALRPDWTLALTSLGSLLVQLDKYADAEASLNKVLVLEPQNPPALAAMVDLRLRTRSSTAVLQDLLTRVTSLTSKANPTVTLWTARAALENALGRSELAKISLNRVLAIDPKNRSALFEIARKALDDGDLERAKSIATALSEHDNGSDDLTFLWASIYAYVGDADEASKRLTSMHHPTAASDELKQRLVVLRSTDPAELEKQVAADPKNAALLGRLCTLYRKADPNKALDYCRRAKEEEPRNLDHAIGYAAALVQARRFEPAVDLLRRIKEISPENWTARANLATALFQLKRLPEAKVEFEWLSANQPRSAGAYYFLGIINDQLGEYADAMANYQQYLRLADPVENKTDIEKVNLRLPALERQIKNRGKGKNN